jgi:hypothetical protein
MLRLWRLCGEKSAAGGKRAHDASWSTLQNCKIQTTILLVYYERCLCRQSLPLARDRIPYQRNRGRRLVLLAESPASLLDCLAVLSCNIMLERRL